MKGSWRLPIRGRPRGLGVPVEELVPEEGKHLQEASRPAQSRPLHPLLWQRPPKGAEVGKDSTQAACAEGRGGEEESGEERGVGGGAGCGIAGPASGPGPSPLVRRSALRSSAATNQSLAPVSFRGHTDAVRARASDALLHPLDRVSCAPACRPCPAGGTGHREGPALSARPAGRQTADGTEAGHTVSVHLQIPAPALPCGPTAGEGCSRRPPFKTALGGWPGPARR